MSNQFPAFNGVLAFGSLQSTSVFGTEAVPQVMISAGSPAYGAFNAGSMILTDTYAPSFGPLIPTFGGFYNAETSGLTVNRTWTPSQPLVAQTLSAAAVATTYSLSLTSVKAAVGNTYNGYAIYIGTITGGASNAFAGYTFTISGFTNGVNNGTFLCIASTATTLTVYNAAAVAETHAATAASGTTLYTGTIQGGASNSYTGGHVTIAGFTNGVNNGSFLCVGSSATTLLLLNSAGVAETHAATATLNGNMSFSGATINVAVAPIGNPLLDDSAYVAGLTINMNTAAQATFNGSSSNVGVVALTIENSVDLPAGNTSTVQLHQVVNIYTESLIGNFSNPDGVYNLDDHWNYHCAGMGWVGHATGTIGNSAGIFMEGPRVPTGCTLTARYGIFMQPQNQNSGGSNTNAWGVFQNSSTEKNWLGSVFIGSHMGQQAANGDYAGSISSVSGTTVSKTFAVNFTSTPIITVTPTTNAGAFYLSAVSNSGFTVTYATSGAQTFNYQVVGNPN